MNKLKGFRISPTEQDYLETRLSTNLMRGTEKPTTVDKGGWINLLNMVKLSSNQKSSSFPQFSDEINNGDPIKKVTKPTFMLGDTINIGFKINYGGSIRVRSYEGVCIRIKLDGSLSSSFTLRRISFGEGIEMVFPFYSDNIDYIKVVKRRKLRRTKYYNSRWARISKKASTLENIRAIHKSENGI